MAGRRDAYTLLEVILALALAVVVLGLTGMAIQVNLAVANKSRAQVEEAQLARVLLQRIADDLRNAVPFQAASSAASTTATSTSDTSSSSSTTSSSGSSSTGSTTPVSGGVFGTLQQIQIETTRRPRMSRVLAASSTDSTQPARLGDLRTVTYSLGEPSTVDLAQETTSSSGETGLYRREVDRAEFLRATQQGQVETLTQANELLAPEVTNLEFTYYDSTPAGSDSGSTWTSGATTSEEWDTNTSGMLPSAVKVAISIRRTRKSAISPDESEDRSPVVYSLLVELPNGISSRIGGTSSSSSSTTTGGSG